MIRTAKIEDVREIANVHVASWRTTYVGQVPQSFLDELSVPKREAAWTAAFDIPAHRMLVVEIENEIVGFSSFGPSRDGDGSPDIGELYAIYLTGATKGCGVGKALWEQTRDLIKALGYSEVTLWVLDTNIRARRFYEKAGFKLDGAKKHANFGDQEVTELRYRLGMK